MGTWYIRKEVGTVGRMQETVKEGVPKEVQRWGSGRAGRDGLRDCGRREGRSGVRSVVGTQGYTTEGRVSKEGPCPHPHQSLRLFRSFPEREKRKIFVDVKLTSASSILEGLEKTPESSPGLSVSASSFPSPGSSVHLNLSPRVRETQESSGSIQR